MFKRLNSSEPALHINEIDVNDKYEFLKKIGQGSYGEVWLVLPNKSSSKKFHKKQHVLKRLNLGQAPNNPSQNDIESAEREAQLLSTLKHPNIVAYIESFRSKDGFLNIVMAYCEGGDLYTKLKERKAKKESLSENQIVEWFIQICMALQYMHDKNILHRDLKTQNIFLTKNEIVKVGDLGIARVLESVNDFATTFIGTPYYMSPEIFSHKPYGQKSDIWSLGCCVYEMITLEHAFNAKNIDSLISKIIVGQTPQISKKYSEPLVDVITSMLKKNPDDRPTAKAILQNSYIKQHILRLLEKTQIKCQNQVTSYSQPIVSASPVSASSSPSRLTSASNHSPSKSRFPSHNNNTPVLPSYSSSHSRPTSSADVNRSSPLAEPVPSNEPQISGSRARRIQARRSNPLPTNDQEKNMKFISNVSHNDTLQRRNRDRQLNNPLKQHQQSSSSEEHDASPIRSANDNAASSPVIIVEPSRRQLRPSSVESDITSSRPPPHSRVTKSYDLNQGSNSSARQRRRENKLHSSSTEYSSLNNSPNQTLTNNELPRSTSQDNLTAEIEKKKEGEKDMNDLVSMLTATLHLTSKHSSPSSESIDNNRTVIENRHSQNNVWSSGDRTVPGPLHETNRLRQRCQSIQEDCLREISPEKLRRVLKILENVCEAQMMEEMIEELGEKLYQKYSTQIFLLKFYEDNLLIHL